MALGGRRIWSWTDTSEPNAQFVHWNAEQIIPRFGLKKKEHIAITKIKALQTDVANTGVNELLLLCDGKGMDVTKLEAGTLTTLERIAPIGSNSSNIANTEKILWCTMDGDNFADVDQPTEPIEVWESILFVKAATLSFTFLIDFVYMDGDMRWPVENFLDDFKIVARERTAGNPFFQVGNIRVLGEREF